MIERLLLILIAALMKRRQEEALIVHRGEIWSASQTEFSDDYRFGVRTLKVEASKHYNNDAYLIGRGIVEVNKEREAMR